MFSLFKRKNPQEKLENLLNGYELPSFNNVVMKVLQQLRNPETTLNSIADQMNMDPALVLDTF